MQTNKPNTLKTTKALAWMSISPLGVLGLPRYLYQGNTGLMKDIFFYYFLVILVAKIGMLHMVRELAPAWLPNFTVASNWMLGLVVLMHVGIFLHEVEFFFALKRSTQKGLDTESFS